ncbi:MAG: DUF1851 domain-containing protein [Verrucomicrobiae bacterium]|nr:DUF1851 domain-containing protein [Verrucomicrobiae bacterium]MCP5551835.1 DUF1851 domain-containing protein [Akkermansiaceae bacterium]
MPPEVYTLDPGEHEWEALLRPWDWRLPEAYAVRLANRYGDVFLEVPGAGVMALDIGQGTLEPVAASLEEFERGLEDPEKAAMWLMIPLVDQLVASGSRPGPGQCYSFARPPSAGGDYAAENTAVVDVAAHFAIYADLQRTLRRYSNGQVVHLDLDGGWIAEVHPRLAAESREKWTVTRE